MSLSESRKLITTKLIYKGMNTTLLGGGKISLRSTVVSGDTELHTDDQ